MAHAVAEAGLSRRCPTCRPSHFPRTDPVVIMLVDDGAGHVLLGRRIGWAERRFSILAGYVAPGETPEEAVVREVLEESGVSAHVAALRRLAAVAVPGIADARLRGQRRAGDGDPVPQPGEMAEVRWFSLEEIRAATGRWEAGAHGGGRDGLRLPGEVSIARALIDAWVARGGRRAQIPA